MTKQESNKINAQRAKEILRKRALESYYENPNRCKHCGIVILVMPNRSPSVARSKKFCTQSCAAQFNNKKFPKRTKVESAGVCQRCGKEGIWKRCPSGAFSRRKYCDNCYNNVLVENARKNITASLKKNGNDWAEIANMTKEEVFSRSSTWQIARTAIRKHGLSIYRYSGKPYVCMVCGYDYHVEICHVKDVKDFGGQSLISEINDTSNLIALCPNHHKEFDDGHIQLTH